MLYLVNAFSLNMVAELLTSKDLEVNVKSCPNPAGTLELQPHTNAIGHEDLDGIIRQRMALDDVYLPKGERLSLSLGAGDELLVAQYVGPRLPEGAAKLPEGSTIKWYYVYLTTVEQVSTVRSF